MKVSIIIPNYNGEHLLKKNLPFVLQAAEFYEAKSKGTIEIIIIDDASSDNSIVEIKNQESKIKNNIDLKIIINDRNLGFPSTVNRGVKESNGEVVVLLNTDVSPEKDFLVPLVDHFSQPNLFGVGCMDKSIEHGKEILRGRGLGSWKRGFLVHRRGEVDKQDTLWVNGGSGAFRKSIWEKLQGFNELYAPFYWEDIDLSYRALKSGYTIVFDAKSMVIHKHEEGTIKSRFTEKQIKTIAYRNQFVFVWLNATDVSILLSHIFWLPYHFVTMAVKAEWIFFRGFVNACLLLPKIIHYRSQQKQQYTKSDAQVIKMLSSR